MLYLTISVMVFLVIIAAEGIQVSLNLREASMRWTALAVLLGVMVQLHPHCSSVLVWAVNYVA